MIILYIIYRHNGMSSTEIDINYISQKCSIHNMGRKGILIPNGEVPIHIRQEDETAVTHLPFHE